MQVSHLNSVFLFLNGLSLYERPGLLSECTLFFETLHKHGHCFYNKLLVYVEAVLDYLVVTSNFLPFLHLLCKF